MHIAFVNHTAKWGGVKTWCLAMAESASAAGHTASIYGQDPVFIARAKAAGVTAYTRSRTPDYNPFAIAWYMNVFRTTCVDVVVVNVSKDVRTAGIAARLLGLPVIRHVGAPYDFPDTLKIRMDHWLCSPSFVCCSQYTLSNVLKAVPHVGCYEHIAIHPGTRIPSSLTCVENEPLRLVTTSRLSADKCHKDVIEALLHLRENGHIPYLDIVGDGPMRSELEAFVHQHGLEEQVRFHGFTSDVGQYLSRSDIFVLPSLHEPLGIALEEGMAHGLIPIARNEGGVPEIWPSGLESLLVDKDAGPRAFAAVLQRVLEWDNETRNRVREDVHASAAEKFSQQGQFIAFYTRVQHVIERHNRNRSSRGLQADTQGKK